MELTEPLYESRMRGFEMAALVYELPVMVAALVGGSILGLLYAFIVIRYGSTLSPLAPVLIMLGMVAAGLVFIFWGATYYATGVMVFADRIRFKMVFSHREVPVSEIASIEALDLDQARWTLWGFRHANLTPSVQGAVMLTRKRGRPWVFSPEDPEAFILGVKKIMSHEDGKSRNPESASDPNQNH